jgi:CcmD family protein
VSSNAVYAFAAYALVWLVVFGYVLLLARRQADLDADLRDLSQHVQSHIDRMATPHVAGLEMPTSDEAPTATSVREGAGSG